MLNKTKNKLLKKLWEVNKEKYKKCDKSTLPLVLFHIISTDGSLSGSEYSMEEILMPIDVHEDRLEFCIKQFDHPTFIFEKSVENELALIKLRNELWELKMDSMDVKRVNVSVTNDTEADELMIKIYTDLYYSLSDGYTIKLGSPKYEKPLVGEIIFKSKEQLEEKKGLKKKEKKVIEPDKSVKARYRVLEKLIYDYNEEDKDDVRDICKLIFALRTFNILYNKLSDDPHGVNLWTMHAIYCAIKDLKTRTDKCILIQKEENIELYNKVKMIHDILNGAISHLRNKKSFERVDMEYLLLDLYNHLRVEEVIKELMEKAIKAYEEFNVKE